MNIKKKYRMILVVTIMVLANILSIKASNSDKLLSEAINISEEAYVKFDKGLYLKSHGMCERVLSADPNNKLAQYYLSYNKYRLINMAMINKDLNQFDLYYDSAIELLESLVNDKEYNSESKALLAAIFMMKLATDQSDPQTLSMKVNSNLEQAIKIDSTNPRSYLIKGTMLLNTPPMFGGSVEGALQNFTKAIKLFESQYDNIKIVKWGYLETLAWNGMALAKIGEYVNAKSVYEKALNIESNYGWVKYKLLPELENISKEKETSLNENLSTLKILVTGFSSNDGALMMKLNNSRDEFESKATSFRSAKNEIINGKVEYIFVDLPLGEYALSCYHDVNNNKKLDSNFLGIPKESYGFSNNAKGSFGPPSYDDVKFKVDKKNVTIIVNLD